MIPAKNRTVMFEKVLEDLGFTSTERSWPFMEDGHRKIAHIHAKDLYEIIQTLDFDDIQETVGEERVPDSGGESEN